MSQNNMEKQATPRQRRPFLLRLAGLSFLALAINSAYRLLALLGGKAVLDLVLLPTWLPTYLAVSGLIWAILCLLAYVALLLRTRWALTAAWSAMLIYLVSFWAERLWVWQDAANARNWLFYALLSLAWIGLCLGAFSLPATRRFLNMKTRGDQ